CRLPSAENSDTAICDQFKTKIECNGLAIGLLGKVAIFLLFTSSPKIESFNHSRNEKLALLGITTIDVLDSSQLIEPTRKSDRSERRNQGCAFDDIRLAVQPFSDDLGIADDR